MQKDTIGFHRIYEQYSADIFKFSYWLTGNETEARDLVAETFVRAWVSDTEPQVESVKAYLCTIARNLFLQGLRNKKRRAEFPNDLQDPSPRPDEAAMARSDLEHTMKALRTLPELDRSVLIMRAEEEMSYEEIARATGLSVPAAKVRVCRARAKLHQLLRQQ